jgi:hypothetical protein
MASVLASPPVSVLSSPPEIEPPPDTAVVAQPTGHEPPTFFYVTMETTRGSDVMIRDRILRSPEDVRRQRRSDHGTEGTRIRRVRFVPLARDKRFAVCQSNWCPRHPDSRVAEWGTPGYEAAEKAWFEGWKTMPRPRSLLDFPPALNRGQSGWTQDTFPLDRAEALDLAAQSNLTGIREAVEEHDYMTTIDWHVVVELGRPIPYAFLLMDFDYNGIGVMTREYQWPLRLVRPSEEEVARFPLPEGVWQKNRRLVTPDKAEEAAYPIPGELLQKGGA